jgi:hypothetical protein
MQDFTDHAVKLARNPLGIVALFIVLVYSIAGLVLGLSGDALDNSQRTILVWFLVLFPCGVLAGFLWLVSQHHSKLYAPSDFRDDSGFIKTLSPEQQRVKVERDVKDLVEERGTQNLVAAPEPVIRNTVVVAEDLVLRELEGEYGVSINRQVEVGGVAQLDGVFMHQGEVLAVEVKYTPSRLSRNRVAESLRQLETHARRLPWRRFKFIYAVVVDDLDEINLADESSRLQEVTSVFPFQVILKIYGFRQLKEKFGVSKPRS